MKVRPVNHTISSYRVKLLLIFVCRLLMRNSDPSAELRWRFAREVDLGHYLCLLNHLIEALLFRSLALL